MILIVVNTSLYLVMITVNHTTDLLLEMRLSNILDTKNIHSSGHSSRFESSQTDSSGQLVRLYGGLRYMERTPIWHDSVDGSAQDCSNSTANPLESLQSSTKPFDKVPLVVHRCIYRYHYSWLICWFYPLLKWIGSLLKNLHREHMFCNPCRFLTGVCFMNHKIIPTVCIIS